MGSYRPRNRRGVILFFFLFIFLDKIVRIWYNNKTVSYGKDTANGNVYYEIPSWVPKFGVVVSKLPATIIDISLNHYEAYDKDRLPFVVDVKAFFRINDFTVAASRVPTLDELYDQLTSIVQGAVRSILAKEYLEDIMSKRSEYGELFSKEVEPQLKEWGVMSVKNIELMDIKDAGGEEVISNIMMKKNKYVLRFLLSDRDLFIVVKNVWWV